MREWLLDLVRREALCCPFLSYEVDAADSEIVWTISGLGASDMAAFDEVLASAATITDSTELARRLESRGGIPIITP